MDIPGNLSLKLALGYCLTSSEISLEKAPLITLLGVAMPVNHRSVFAQDKNRTTETKPSLWENFPARKGVKYISYYKDK